MPPAGVDTVMGMRSAEIRAAGDLAGRALAGTGTVVRDVHAAIARRAFDAVGPGGEPARAVHDGVSAAVYGGVRATLRAVPRGAGSVLAQRRASDAPSLADSPRGALALAALNGAIGDALHLEGSDLALRMTLRLRGADVDPDAPALDGTRLAVFVHGLGETDAAWRLHADPQRPGYGACLRRDFGYAPLELRYNSGRHISDNGRELARLLDRLTASAPVDEIVLVGHSMGGLVARSACHYGQLEGRAWASAVRHVFCLGSPHLGAPLEKGVNALGWALDKLAETRPVARIVNGRSVGIKDLRYGACVEEDWCDCDADELLTDRCHDVPFLPNARFYFVAATLSGPSGELLGDLLVRYRSAAGAGRKRRIPFALDDGHRLHGLTHFDLLNHPAVYEQMRAWLRR
jgi:pimeloyl-ACP methyl ester carboxylesterase